jgi:hypothetical protein
MSKEDLMVPEREGVETADVSQERSLPEAADVPGVLVQKTSADVKKAKEEPEQDRRLNRLREDLDVLRREVDAFCQSTSAEEVNRKCLKEPVDSMVDAGSLVKSMGIV